MPQYGQCGKKWQPSDPNFSKSVTGTHIFLLKPYGENIDVLKLLHEDN